MLQNAGEESVANLDRMRYANGTTPTAEHRLRMQKVMQTHAAVFREGPSLDEGCKKLDVLWDEQADIKVTCWFKIILFRYPTTPLFCVKLSI